MEVINTSRCTHRWRHLCIRGCMFLRVRDSCCDIFRGWNILSLEYYARSWCAVPIVFALMKLSYFSSLCLSLFVLKPLFLIMQECMFFPPPPLFTQGSVTENDEQSYPGTPYSALSLLHILKPEFDWHMPSHAGSCVCAHTRIMESSTSRVQFSLVILLSMWQFVRGYSSVLLCIRWLSRLNEKNKMHENAA